MVKENKLKKGDKVYLSKRYRKFLYDKNHEWVVRPSGEVCYKDLALSLMVRKDTVGEVTCFGMKEFDDINNRSNVRFVGVNFHTKIGDYFHYFSESDLISLKTKKK